MKLNVSDLIEEEVIGKTNTKMSELLNKDWIAGLINIDFDVRNIKHSKHTSQLIYT